MGQTPEPAAPAIEPEVVTPPVGAPDPAAEVPEVAPEAPVDPRITAANKEAAKYRKELRETQAALKAREDAEKTEAQLAADRASAAEAQVADLLRRSVAAEVGLPPELRDRLRGDNEDALREDAESLKALLVPAAPVDPASAPWPDAPQGPRGNPKPASIAQQIADAEAAGDWPTATRLKTTQVAQQTPVGP